MLQQALHRFCIGCVPLLHCIFASNHCKLCACMHIACCICRHACIAGRHQQSGSYIQPGRAIQQVLHCSVLGIQCLLDARVHCAEHQLCTAQTLQEGAAIRCLWQGEERVLLQPGGVRQCTYSTNRGLSPSGLGMCAMRTQQVTCEHWRPHAAAPFSVLDKNKERDHHSTGWLDCIDTPNPAGV